MATRRDSLRERVTPSHLQAIGRVAVEWSRVEIDMLSTISKMSGAHIYDVVVLAGPANFASWVDMLIMECRASDEHEHNENRVELVCGLLKKLQRLRNYIIHASWTPQISGIGLASILNPGIRSGRDTVKGFGIPKRGREALIRVHWTAPQMRRTANLISKARRVLLEIADLKKPASPEEQRGLARKDRTIRRQIRKMLDSLPDPFQRL